MARTRMWSSKVAALVWLLFQIVLAFHHKEVRAVNVTYDHRSLLIDGKRRILNSGSIHYPRSTPEMWPKLIAQAKEGGLDVIETYVFWDAHEPAKGIFNFEGRFNLVRFIKDVHQAGLFANLRIGPYISAEWNFGGLPVWLHFEPRVVFRMDSVPFKAEMKRFVTKIVAMVKEEKLFAWQGGPIILAQIENEFGYYPPGTPQHAYAMWAAEMALSLHTGVPWIMCLQYDAPDPIINTFNSYYADDFYPNGKDKPKMWTEDWTGWFQSYGSPTPYRPVEDLAYAVSRFFQKNGSFQNYYMYHGGTNFGRTSGGPFITTSYDYDAPLDEYGLKRQPKWGHLKELHQSLKLCESALTTGDATMHMRLGPKQEAYVFSNESENCAAFLSNSDVSDKNVLFNGQSYNLPAWSVSILPDCKSVVFNSAKVSSQTCLMSMKPVSRLDWGTTRMTWDWYKESARIWGRNTVKDTSCLEQINITRDTTDYLWYITSVQVSEDEPFIKNGTNPVLVIESMRDAVHVFINGKLANSSAGNPYVEVIQPIKFKEGLNKIAILSMTVGLQAGGAGYDMVGTGIQGSVLLKGFKNGTLDLSTQLWTHQIGIKGENLSIYKENGVQNVKWTSAAVPPQNQSLIWYKTTFDAPTGDDPIALDLVSMRKGQAWINGESIGRFWPSYITSKSGCTSTCDYRGVFNQTKCLSNCGQPSQRWYHVPRSWLKPTGNLLVLFEEVGGDPTMISLVARVVDKVCAYVSEDYPPLVSGSVMPNADNSEISLKPGLPQVRLDCGEGKVITSVAFASFGTPQGNCGNFQRGLCHASSSLSVIKKACVGHTQCSIDVLPIKFGEDPCPQVLKTLAVEAQCGL